MSADPMTRRYQQLVTLQLWHLRTLELQTAWDEFSDLAGLSPESRLSNAVWMTHGEYTRTVGREIGDDAGWLDWWHYDCNLGTKVMNASRRPGGPCLPVVTLVDLLDVIVGVPA